MNRRNLVIILMLVGVMSSSCTDGKPNDLKFDSIKWKAGNPRQRGQMVHDLFENHGLRGKQRAEIINVLGHGQMNETTFISYEISYGHVLEKISVSRLYFIVEFDPLGQSVIHMTFADA